MSNVCIICKKEYIGNTCTRCGFCHDKANGPQCLAPGTDLLDGRYTVGYAVGIGGFGITYLAWDNTLQQKVAIKEYMPGEFSTRMHGAYHVTVYGGEKEEQYRDGLNKFFEESQQLAKFREVPGIVQIYDCFKENETAYIVMEYLEGETLGNRLKREHKIKVTEALEIIKPVLTALEEVHKEGIIHRDIAPNNIFLTTDGRIKLLDFGAARNATGTHSKSLTVLYKEGFTAEEQYRSRGEQGPWTDVYAVGATLYKMLTGETPVGAMERRAADKLKRPRQKGVSINKNIEHAIMNALNVDYKKRTQSAEEFISELFSNKAVKRRYERTSEKKVGKIPVPVWIISGSAVVAAGVLFVLLRMGIIHFYSEAFTNLFVESGKARIMNVVNMEEEEAISRLEKIGLKLEVTGYKYDNDILPGRIISQEEAKGAIVPEGTSIHVIVSKEAELVEIPEIEGIKQDEAEALLDQLGLKSEIKETTSPFLPGIVVGCTPVQGEQILQGKTVTIMVSSGLVFDSNKKVTVGNYIEKNVDDTRTLLAEEGIYLVEGEFAYDDFVPKGFIIQQDYEEGDIVSGGDVITVIVSLGIEQKEVPNLIGMKQDDVEDLLEKMSLVPVISTIVDMDAEEGSVISQEVDSGTMIDKYSEIPIGVAIHGYLVPNLIGKTQADAEALVRESGLTFSIERARGQEGAIVSQEPSGGEIMTNPGNVKIRVGVSDAEFTNALVEEINKKRSANGLGSMSLDNNWNKAAQDLAVSGKTSGDFFKGYDYTWAVAQYDSYPNKYTFWATRDGINSVEDAVSRLPWSDSALLGASNNVLGVGYNGTRISVLIGWHY